MTHSEFDKLEKRLIRIEKGRKVAIRTSKALSKELRLIRIRLGKLER